MQIEYDVHGAENVLVRIRAQNEHVRDQIRSAIAEALEAAEKTMLAGVPRQSTVLASSIVKTPVVYIPGGPGGGGYFQGEVEVGAGVPYLNLVVEGTGVFGPRGGAIKAGEGNIGFKRAEWPTPHGSKFMVWESGGQKFFRRQIKGQRPKTRWFEDAHIIANEIIKTKVGEIDLHV